MKAIETRWNGYRFRSRLEARWAVYFEAMGLQWEYEPEGFEFDDGTRYLPDFWLPEVHQWAEVKPEPLTKDEMNKVYLLSRHTEKFVLALVGVPSVQAYEGFLAFETLASGRYLSDGTWEPDPEHAQEQFWDPGIDSKYGTGLRIHWCLGSMAFILEKNEMNSGSVFLTTAPSYQVGDIEKIDKAHQELGYDCCDSFVGIRRAVEIARSARFEFGDSHVKRSLCR